MRRQSFSVTADATFRIQYHDENMYFAYLPPEVDLLTSPRGSATNAPVIATVSNSNTTSNTSLSSVTNAVTGTSNYHTTPTHSIEEDTSSQPQTKRAKV